MAAKVTPYTYQWEKSEDGGDSFTAITGATTDTLTLNAVKLADSGTQYRCVVNNIADSPATSSAATLTVKAPPVAVAVSITKQPEDMTVTAGEDATFTVKANGTKPYTYQWEKSEDGGDSFTAITGATTDTLTLNAVTLGDNGTQYRCVVNNIADSPATSSAATLTVTALPITGLPNPYTMGLGSSVTWDPQPSGGTWDWDEEFFSATFSSTATFTALRTGTSTISYTVHGTAHVISVTVSGSLPSTGPEQDFLWLYTLVGTATCIIAAAVLAYVKRMARE